MTDTPLMFPSIREGISHALADGKPHTSKEIREAADFRNRPFGKTLWRLVQKGRIVKIEGGGGVPDRWVRAPQARKTRLRKLLGEMTSFDVTDETDARERTDATIAMRRGQPAFRRTLLTLYEGRCAITGCDAAEALEAAHILPYRGPWTNHPANGLLLRADIHTLFDLGLIAVDTRNRCVLIAPSLRDTVYEELHGRRILLPAVADGQPSMEALDRHREQAGLYLSLTSTPA